MDIEPLAPQGNSKRPVDMALTLTSSSSSYGQPINKFPPSETEPLFGTASRTHQNVSNYGRKLGTSMDFRGDSGESMDSDASSASSPNKDVYENGDECLDEEEENRTDNFVNDADEDVDVGEVDNDDDDDGDAGNKHLDADASESDLDNDLIECASCDDNFLSMESYMRHPCVSNKSFSALRINGPVPTSSSRGMDLSSDKRSEVNNMPEASSKNRYSNVKLANNDDMSDAESFDGKIVYNSDGSAYIIEGGDSDLSDLDALIDLPPDQEGVIVDRKGSNTVAQVPALPYVANAFFVSRNPSANSIYQATPSSRPLTGQAPMMFSYRVYDLRSGKFPKTSSSCHDDGSETTSESMDEAVPTKPILMCFICKLSFGYTKSFMVHAETEHDMTLSSQEVKVMSQPNASAIIQCVGREKQPLMSFLEPKALHSSNQDRKKLSSLEVEKSDSDVAISSDNTSVSFVYSRPKFSDSLAHAGHHSVLPSDRHKRSSSSSQGKFDLYNLPSSQVTTSALEPNGYHVSKSPMATTAKGTTDLSGMPCSSPYDSDSLSRDRYWGDEDSMQRDRYSGLDTRCSPNTPCSIPSPLTPGGSLMLGMCEDHPQGRAQGVECPKCDLVLGSTQSLGGHMTMMHSRNSCKTLKCPKCNWHYKYQETLEIHMKEKHPESDQQCVYCLTNQAHPRLARGESYSCGYKPYRCQVCNYSTTTKGNLSIHMQSDKHLNNVQELANGGGEMKLPPQPQVASSQQPQDVASAKKNKPKPTWRCDVCNYETNVARNLRIHMTSEKHTHNMMVLQQNMKHMQRDMHLQQLNHMMLVNDQSFLSPHPSPVLQGNIPYSNYDHGLLMSQGMHRNYADIPVDLRKENGIGPGTSFDPSLADPSRMFHCCMCNTFCTDSLESLHSHLQVDRTKVREQESITVSQGSYTCNLCTYKTTLKANFQLHCKTDKHLQRLQLVNHIKEGGVGNEWRLKYLNVSNPVQVRCNCCDYYTNSIHKLQIHTANTRHEANAQLFQHLQRTSPLSHGSKISPAHGSTKPARYYHCSLCNFSTRTKFGLIAHVHSLRHMQGEGLRQMQMKDDGQMDMDPAQIFQVREYQEDQDKVAFDDEDVEGEDPNSVTCEQESSERKFDVSGLYSSPQQLSKTTSLSHSSSIPTETSNARSSQPSQDSAHACRHSNASEMRIQAHTLECHAPLSTSILCPLCQEAFKEKVALESHLMTSHSVRPEGLQKLLLMVDQGDWMAPPTSLIGSSPVAPGLPLDESGDINTEELEAEAARLAAEDAIDTASLPEKADSEEQYRCQTCSKTFINIDALYAHQNELGHLELKQTPRGPGYLCWKKGCNQYFKTAQALQVHFREIHAKRQPLEADSQLYKHHCDKCSLAFKSAEKLQLHQHFHLIQAATSCMFCAKSFRSITALRKHMDSGHPDLSDSERDQALAVLNDSTAALASVMKVKTLGSRVPSADSPSTNSTVIVNSLTSPVVTAITSNGDKDKSNVECTKMDINENVDGMGMSQDDQEVDNDEGLDLSQSLTNGDDSLYGLDEEFAGKDPQSLEDFINSQAMAEGSYDDPSRKYKCHRCKLAFTKQNYLTAHNKTQLHRRGDKLAFALDKYLDPNRPYKCDVCKESFTQKSILLVHNNSVSHLHKLKQNGTQVTSATATTAIVTSPAPVMNGHSMQGITEMVQKSTSSETVKDISRSVSSTPTSHREQTKDDVKPYADIADKTSAFATTLTPARTISSSSSIPSSSSSAAALSLSLQQEGEKPYRCNICHQSYAQGSTLDVHIRSVAHQTRASKLHELVIMGQVDLSRPLIEQPHDKEITPQQQKKILAEILQTQQLLGMSHPGLLFPPGLNPLVSTHLSLADPMLLTSLASSVSSGFDQKQRKKGDNLLNSLPSKMEVDTSELSLDLPSHMISGMSPYLPSGSSSSPVMQTKIRPRSFFGRFKTEVQRNLLENIGFECVMQFNEFNQRSHAEVPEKKEEEEEEDEEEDDDDDDDDREGKMVIDLGEEEKMEEDGKEAEKEKEDEKKESDLPELNRCVCSTCGKEFSSVWVLKAHQEEVHKDIVPIKAVEDFGQKFRHDFEKKQPKETEPLSGSLGSVETPPTSSANVSQEKEVSEMPPPPPPPPHQLNAPLDLQSMMPMFGLGLPMPMPFGLAMNMQPQLMPMMFPMGPDAIPTSSSSESIGGLQKQQQQQHQMAAAQQAAAMQNQKRARTRINDEQLKILRQNFDINNSPSEEQILGMSEQSGLPTKVIKHWFRNTLFKERQRNKDSPYNFNNPPSTTLDLEEYEKTGKLPVIEEGKSEEEKVAAEFGITIKKEVKSQDVHEGHEKKGNNPVVPEGLLPAPSATSTPIPHPSSSLGTGGNPHHLPLEPHKLDIKAEPMSREDVLTSRCRTPEHNNDSFDSMSNMSSMSNTSSLPMTPTPFQVPNMGGMGSGDIRPRFEPTPQYSKRANRTRFTDYQIKVLQEYFEQNAYPKDDELDHLSSILNLSPRVIVVWFQNARQKARKIYENQPNAETKEASPFNRTPGLNYQCKKCNSVFQRYYDLIRHQKKPCGEGEKQSASNMSHQLSNHGADDDSDSLSTFSQDELNQSETGSTNSFDHSMDKADSGEGIKYRCEKCNMSFEKLEAWQDHQSLHVMNPGLFSDLASNSAFGVLQSMAAAQQQENRGLFKRKMDDSFEDDRDDQPRDKRLRTTILPEQLDYLYQKYQVDCNPSRKQLENISRDVGLKKRVVQVWFQNTRARERKGQYRAHQQLIHKRCPFCRALFRAKSALESHLATKHPEEMAKGEVNIDALPDATIESPLPPPSPSSHLSPSKSAAASSDINKLLSQSHMQSLFPIMPPTSLSLGSLGSTDPLQMSMKQFYEDSFKKYMSELSTHPKEHLHRSESSSLSGKFLDAPPKTSVKTSTPSSSSSAASSAMECEAPLDLSKPLKVTVDHDRGSDGPSTDLSERSSGDHSDRLNSSLNNSFGEPPTSRSPMSSHDNLTPPVGKRYRTQMTSLQVRVMKNIFIDYKTPTMAECEMLGREIGLPKRVVQVWFQNARAKEKKSKLAMSSGYGADLDYHKPPEECKICKFKYSHKYTIQDHIFTKKHIDKVRTFIQSQCDVERDLTTPTSMPDPMRRTSEVDRMRKAWDEASSLSQLQAMGLGSMGLSGSNRGMMGGYDDVKKENSKESKKDVDKRSENSKREQALMAAQLAAQQMGSLSGFMPGFDPAMLPFMYGGLPGFLPGMGMPFMQPGLMPGFDPMMPYDPLTFGTPLQLLQIPSQAIKDVSIKLLEPNASIAQYTQDCKSISSLRSLVSSIDYGCVREATVDVGYICKKCQMVYPAKEACVTHQQTLCLMGKNPEGMQPMLKLEQIQYECRLCSDKFSTVQEYKTHCGTEAHKKKVACMQEKSSTSLSSSSVLSMSSSSLLSLSSSSSVTAKTSLAPMSLSTASMSLTTLVSPGHSQSKLGDSGIILSPNSSGSSSPSSPGLPKGEHSLNSSKTEDS